MRMRDELQKAASHARLQYAIFRWETAVVLAGTLLLVVFLPQPFTWWPFWGWPILGVLGTAGVIYSSLTDAQANALIWQQLLEQRLDPNQIRDPQLRRRIVQLFEIQGQLEVFIRSLKDGAFRTQVEALAGGLADWVAEIYRVTRYCDTYIRDFRLEDKQKLAPEEIKTLAARRRFERAPQMVQRLDEAMEKAGRSWQTLRILDAEIRQVEPHVAQQLIDVSRTVHEVVDLKDDSTLQNAQVARLCTETEAQAVQVQERVERIHALYSEALADA
ncbi:MAG: hypothetical protein JXB35_11020 [Anaerolineae bacterium]|nr:hypothetical protein [Anaerolineae bacterium]